MQANDLHREVAFLSNTLAEYADDDVEGVRPVIAKIVQTRDEWRRVIRKINYYKKTGRKAEDNIPQQVVAANPENIGRISEMKVALALLNSNISKTKRKLETTPEHKKAQHWTEDLAKMEALKTELKTQITQLTYATA